MSSLMMGIETAMRSLRTHTTAINTVGHNIANMNNADYSRQLTGIAATMPFSPSGYVGQIGTGSQANMIERIRNTYLDKQIRLYEEYLGKWSVIDRVSNNLKAVFPEVDGVVSVGLEKDIEAFFTAWDDVAAQAKLAAAGSPNTLNAAKSNVYEVADSMAQLLNSKARDLTNMQIDLNSQVRLTVQDINSQFKQIYELNKQIVQISALKQQPNDLLDKRDAALAKLSGLVNVNIANRNDGSVVVTLAGFTVVNGADNYSELTTKGGVKDSKLEQIAIMNAGTKSVVIENKSITGGELAGLIQSRDETIQDYMIQLDNIANTMITVVNTFHRSGQVGGVYRDFFTGKDASSIAVNNQLANGQNVAHSRYETSPYSGAILDPGDIAASLGALDNKLINNWLASTKLQDWNGPFPPPPATKPLTSGSKLGLTGTLTINNKNIFFNSSDTIADLVRKLNADPSSFSAVFDETTSRLYIVGNSLMTVTDSTSGGLLLNRLNLYQETFSASEVQYTGSIRTNLLVYTKTWDQQANGMDVEATDKGTVTVTYNGISKDIDWKNTENFIDTYYKIGQFNGASNPKLTEYSFDSEPISLHQKFVFGTSNNSGAGSNTIVPFTIADKTGNLTRSMKLVSNMRFGDYYKTILGGLSGEIASSDTILAEYKAALDQVKGMQEEITKVDEKQELALAKQYQRAYDASVRLMAVIDEMLNMLINRTATSSSSTAD